MGTDLGGFESYQMAESLAQLVWGIVDRWKTFERQTIGSQLVRAADSVGANIGEAHGRFYYGEKIQFLYYARGSLYETRHWLRLAWRRNLLTREETKTVGEILEPLAKSLNRFASSLKQQRGDARLKEESATYGDELSISNLHISNLNDNHEHLISKDDILWLTQFNANAS